MKKNGQYIGVDERFIPEDEKYVDEPILGNKENAKNIMKKTTKVIGIGFITYLIISLVITAFVLILMFKIAGNIFNTEDGMSNQVENIFNRISGQIENSIVQSNNADSEFEQQKSNVEKDGFNSGFEIYSGTQRKNFIMLMLDKVINNNKTNSNHIITVIYNENNTTDSNHIVELKRLLDETKEYEIMLDYDENGYVNQVTIMDI